MTAYDNRAVFERSYDAQSYRPRRGYFEALFATRLAMLQELPPDSRVLDLGCGSGAFLLPLARAGYRVTGLDYSPRILAALHDEAALRGVDPSAFDVVSGDACAMPLPDAAFDAVFSFATLYAIPDVERVLAEIARVLRPGGVAFLELGNARSLNAIEASRVGNGLASFHQTPGRMRHLLRASGLAVQRVRAFQMFPLWGGGTERAERLLNPRLGDVLAAADVDGVMLDERLCRSPWLQPFAFRQLCCVTKGGAEAPSAPPPPLPPEDPAQRERRRAAAERCAAGDVAQAVELLLECVQADPGDPRPALDLAALYDGDAEQRLVRRWRRTLTRSGRWPLEGAALTPPPPRAPVAPRVSIVLPTFDAGDLLPEALASVFAQTFGDFELIVVDDGSRDDTQRCLGRLTDPRVTVVRQANQRLPTALNRGFSLARGEYRTWISADNVCAPTMLATLVAALDRRADAQLAVAAFERCGRRLEPRGVVGGQDVSFAGFLPRNPGVAAFLYRSATARLVGDYEPSLEGAEDWDYWLRLLAHGPAVRVDDVLYRYREHGRSMTATIPVQVQRASELVVRRLCERHGGLPPLAELDGEPGAWFRLGTRLLESPFAPEHLAAEALHRALQHDPHDGRALVQLTVALARAGATREAARLARRFADAADPGLCRLAGVLARLAAGDRTIDPAKLPLLPVDEPALV